MTKKHFEAIASYLSEMQIDITDDYSRGYERARVSACDAIAEVCADCNSRFDHARFMRACGVTE